MTGSWKSRRLLLVGLTLAAAIVVAILTMALLPRLTAMPVSPPHGLARKPASATLAVGPVPSEAVPGPTAVSRSAASTACKEQEIAITLTGVRQRLCFSATQTRQMGSVQSYTVQAEDASKRWLRVDVAGGAIVGVLVGSGAKIDFKCGAAECSGVSLGRRDSLGVRTLSFDNLALQPTRAGGTGPAAAAVTGVATIDGGLKVPAAAALACDGPSVAIIVTDSPATSFCPMGGVGFEVNDDGTRTYRFTSLDDGTILIKVAASMRVSEVDYASEDGQAKCAASACAGVMASVPGVDGERTFDFAGTTLTQPGPGNTVTTLTGTLRVPPLE